MQSAKTVRILAMLLVCLLAVWPIAAQEEMQEDAAESGAEMAEEAPEPTLYEETTVESDAPKAVGQRMPLAHKWAHGALMGCSVENALSMVDAIDALAPDTMDLDALRAKLMADREALAAAQTRDELKTARDAAKDDLAAAKEALKDLRRQGAKLGKEARRQLRTAKDDIQKAFQDCKKQLMLETGKERVDKAAEAQAGWAAKADKLEGKGADASALRSIAKELETVTAPLKAAVASGDPAAIKAAANAMRMQHLHVWARFQVARVQIGADRAKADGADVSAAQAKLDEASALAAPGKPYAAGEHARVFVLLKEAAGLVRDAAKAAKEMSAEVSDE